MFFFSIFSNYLSRIKKINVNCRFLILYLFIVSTCLSIVSLLLNLFLIATGFSKAQVGILNSVNFLGSSLAAIPLAILLERFPRKYPFIVSASVFTLCGGMICFIKNFTLLLIVVFIYGTAQAVFNVLILPFLMENSREQERIYLFSLISAQGWAGGMLGNLLGGFLPSLLMINFLGIDLAGRYRASILLSVALSFLAISLLFFIREKRREPSEEELSSNRLSLFKGGSPLKFLIIELLGFLGAGLFLPYMNIFFSSVYSAPSGSIGIVFTLSSAAALIGTMAVPLLAEKLGKIKTVFLCQILSIPLLLGLTLVGNFYAASAFYILRMALMNMGNPLLDSFGMELVPAARRATFASLMRSASPLAWAMMGPLSGWVMQSYGFQPLFILAIFLYTVSSLSLWWFFGRSKKEDSVV